MNSQELLILLAVSLYGLGLGTHIHLVVLGKIATDAAERHARTRSELKLISQRIQPELKRLLKWAPLWPVVWFRGLRNLLKK